MLPTGSRYIIQGIYLLVQILINAVTHEKYKALSPANNIVYPGLPDAFFLFAFKAAVI